MRAIDHVVHRFPDRVATVRRLYLSDDRFRDACEDLALSLASLRRFEARPDAHLRPEIDDYRLLLRELETELASYLSAAEHG